jgi:hypothetical protein
MRQHTLTLRLGSLPSRKHVENNKYAKILGQPFSKAEVKIQYQQVGFMKANWSSSGIRTQPRACHTLHVLLKVECSQIVICQFVIWQVPAHFSGVLRTSGSSNSRCTVRFFLTTSCQDEAAAIQPPAVLVLLLPLQYVYANQSTDHAASSEYVRGSQRAPSM